MYTDAKEYNLTTTTKKRSYTISEYIASFFVVVATINQLSELTTGSPIVGGLIALVVGISLINCAILHGK